MTNKDLTPFEKAGIFLEYLPEDLAFQFKLYFKISQLELLLDAAHKATNDKNADVETVVTEFMGLESPLDEKKLDDFVKDNFNGLLIRLKRAVYSAHDKELETEAIRKILTEKSVPQGALLLANYSPIKIVDILGDPKFDTKIRLDYVKELESIFTFHGEPHSILDEIIRGLAATDPDFMLAWEMSPELDQMKKYGPEILGLMRRLGRAFEEICIVSEKYIDDILEFTSDMDLINLLWCEKDVVRDRFLSNLPRDRAQVIMRDLAKMPEFSISDAWRARELVVDLIRRLWQKQELEHLERGERRKVCPNCGKLTIVPISKRRLVVPCPHCGEMFIVKPKKTINRRRSQVRLRLDRDMKLPKIEAKELRLLVREFESELRALKEAFKTDFFGYKKQGKMSMELKKDMEKMFAAFAENLAQDFSYNLFVNCDISLKSMTRKTCLEMTLALPPLTNIYVLKARGYEHKLLFEMNRLVVKKIVKFLSEARTRWEKSQGLDLGQVERRVFHLFVDKLAGDFSSAFGVEPPLKLTINEFFDSPAEIENFNMDEEIIHAEFEIVIEGEKGKMNLCLPVRFIESLFQGE